jgi:predicted transposase/invertase (TIGR01784 family)
MPMFDLNEFQLVTPKDKWLFFLKNLESFDDIPAMLREPIFEKAFATAEYLRYSPALKEAYQENLKIYRDNQAVIKTAIDDGYDIGKKDGKLEGFTEGETKGRLDERVLMARKMITNGVDLSIIVKVTGLPLSEIEQMEGICYPSAGQ